jgi:hypothetical protein
VFAGTSSMELAGLEPATSWVRFDLFAGISASVGRAKASHISARLREIAGVSSRGRPRVMKFKELVETAVGGRHGRCRTPSRCTAGVPAIGSVSVVRVSAAPPSSGMPVFCSRARTHCEHRLLHPKHRMTARARGDPGVTHRPNGET